MYLEEVHSEDYLSLVYLWKKKTNSSRTSKKKYKLNSKSSLYFLLSMLRCYHLYQYSIIKLKEIYHHLTWHLGAQQHNFPCPYRADWRMFLLDGQPSCLFMSLYPLVCIAKFWLCSPAMNSEIHASLFNDVSDYKMASKLYLFCRFFFQGLFRYSSFKDTWFRNKMHWYSCI